jgi:hypothetical protein
MMTKMVTTNMHRYAFFLVALFSAVTGFAPIQQPARFTTSLNEGGDERGGIFGAIGNFFEELDAFVDDATSRRLGSGSAFYGKRKSSFYGKKDKNRKDDRDTPDPTEDYQGKTRKGATPPVLLALTKASLYFITGPAQAGYFQWMQDEDTGEMKPVTRLKNKNIERNPKYWDRVYDKDEKE